MIPERVVLEAHVTWPGQEKPSRYACTARPGHGQDALKVFVQQAVAVVRLFEQRLLEKSSGGTLVDYDSRIPQLMNEMLAREFVEVHDASL